MKRDYMRDTKSRRNVTNFMSSIQVLQDLDHAVV